MLSAHVPTLQVALALLMTNLALMWALLALWLRLPATTSRVMTGSNLTLALACLLLPAPPAPWLWGVLVLTLCANTGIALQVLLRLVARLQRLTELDPLTETLNRRAFDALLQTEHARLARGHAYALVMVDMDHFKQLNDKLGHAAGDVGLKTLVQVLRACMRTTDALARVGGEEFALLLPDTDLTGAAMVAERMRLKLASTPLEWQGKTWPLTASFGIAQAQPHEPSPELVLERADLGLYRAKARGRNLVEALA